MSRLPRFLRKGQTTVYHVVSRTALDGLPMKVSTWERAHGTSMIVVVN